VVRPRIDFPCLCGAALLRCRGPPLSRQNDQALIVSAPLYKTGLLGVADRLVEGQTRKTDIATDALGSPPGMWGLGTKAVELDDECRRALKTVLDHAGDASDAFSFGPAVYSRSTISANSVSTCPSCCGYEQETDDFVRACSAVVFE
jgi:hypothetical protein